MHNFMEAPDRLARSRNQIVGAAKKQPKQSFTASRWKYWLTDHPDVMADLIYIVDRFPLELDREDVESIAQEAVKDPSFEHYRRLFLASMIWGYGGKDEDHRGPWRISQALASESFDQTLKETSDHIMNGKTREAYDRFVSGKIRQCRAPFFTKYFYFLGHAAGDTYPLILDSKVDAALRQLVRKNFRHGEEWRREEYMEYLKLICKWARGLGCAPDDIECFLYERSISRHARKTK